jgi:undecaprenyl-diphosphatase
MARWLPLYSKLPDTFPYAPLLLALASFCGFILITASRPWALDTLLMQQVSTWRETAADPVFRGITLIGDPAILGLTGLIVTLWLFISGQSRLSGLLLGFSLLMLWVIPELKSLFAVARPDLVSQLPAGHAYPSGHAAGFAVYLGLAETDQWAMRFHLLYCFCQSKLAEFLGVGPSCIQDFTS